MRFFLFVILLYAFTAIGNAQSVDQNLTNAINNGRWFEVRQLYDKHSTEIQTPILHSMSKFFINHYYNQTDSALYYGVKLLNEYQSDLGGAVGGFIFLIAQDFAKNGEYKKAVSILKQYNEAIKKNGITPEPVFMAYENQYDVVGRKGGFTMRRPENDVKIPIQYLEPGGQDGLIFIDVQLNNHPYNAIWDTGAGENLMSRQLADALNLHIYDFTGTPIAGVRVSNSSFTIVDSLQFGEIVYRNVPFQVVDFSTGNLKADSVIINDMNLNCVLGVRSMLPLNEVHIDFRNGFLEIPISYSEKDLSDPNIYCSGEGVIVMSVLDKRTNKEIEALLDTGSAVTYLTSKYYKENQSLLGDLLPEDPIRIAGIGGVTTLKPISTSWEYSVDNVYFKKESVIVNTATGSDVDGVAKYDCLFGMSSLTNYDRIMINFTNMQIHFSFSRN